MTCCPLDIDDPEYLSFPDFPSAISAGFDNFVLKNFSADLVCIGAHDQPSPMAHVSNGKGISSRPAGTCSRRPCRFPPFCNGLDLDRHLGPTEAGPNGHAGFVLGRRNPGLDFVHCLKIPDVVQKNHRFDGVVARRSRFRQRGFDVLHARRGLCRDTTGPHEGSRSGPVEPCRTRRDRFPPFRSGRVRRCRDIHGIRLEHFSWHEPISPSAAGTNR